MQPPSFSPLQAGPPVWDVTRAPGLGAVAPNLGEWTEHLPELRRTLAGVLVGSGGRDLVFVGRSPEPLQAYLSGLLCGVPVPWRASTLNVSLLHRRLDGAEVRALRPLLTQVGLNPRALATARRHVVLVDVVASGGTFAEVLGVLQDWGEEQGLPRVTVRRRVALLGLIGSSMARPGAWRWAAQASFRDVRSASVLTAWPLWRLLADGGVKLAPQHPPDHWPHPRGQLPERTPERLQAMAQLRALYLLGTQSAERAAMITALNAAGAQTTPALRALIGQWRGGRARGQSRPRPYRPLPRS